MKQDTRNDRFRANYLLGGAAHRAITSLWTIYYNSSHNNFRVQYSDDCFDSSWSDVINAVQKHRQPTREQERYAEAPTMMWRNDLRRRLITPFSLERD